MNRKILHIDQNCFFASVEMINQPELRKVPMAVGGDAEKRHGIILAKNPLAAACGVKTAETIWQAKQKCPKLVVIPGHYEQYNYYSAKLFEMYCQYTDRVEPYGLDECWLDLTDIAGAGDPVCVADEIRGRVNKELGLTCSIGVSFNKVFAKLGSDYKKPDATTYISEENFRSIVWPLPVGDLLFVGRSTRGKLEKINIKTIGALAAMSPDYIHDYLGINGTRLWLSANGLEESPVALSSFKREIKSVGNSTTTARDMNSEQDVWQTIVALSDQVAGRLRKHGLAARTVQIWIRDTSLGSFERQVSLSVATNHADEISAAAMELFKRNYLWTNPVRSLGVRGTQLVSSLAPRQLTLFDDDFGEKDKTAIDQVIDRLRLQYGSKAIRKGVQLACDSKLIENGQLEENRGGFSALQQMDIRL